MTKLLIIASLLLVVGAGCAEIPPCDETEKNSIIDHCQSIGGRLQVERVGCFASCQTNGY